MARDELREVARSAAGMSGGIFRFQPLAAIPIPAGVSMNIVAAVSTGDLENGMMIWERPMLTVLKMKFDPAAISFPVFRFPRAAIRGQAFRPKEKALEFHVRHILSPCPDN
jgi:hypothetical protein